QDMVFDLMFNLDATEEQLDFSTVYGSAKNGWMGPDWQKPTEDVTYLLDQVIEHIPAPPIVEGTLQMQITSLDYSQYIGRIAVGRVSRGSIRANSPVTLVKRDGSMVKSRIKELFIFSGLGREKVELVNCGDICAVNGIENFEIGDTIADFETPEGLPPIAIDEPTMSMLFTVNNSPFYGKEGDFITSRHLRDRLHKELEKNLALRVEETESPDAYMVYGRGVMHLSVLIETMRREGYELQVGKPKVIIKQIDGVKSEPLELLAIDVPEASAGKVIEVVNQRKGEMNVMEPRGDLMHLEFHIPSRGIIGLRNQVLNLTAGEAIMSHRFVKFDGWKGEIPSRNKGVLIVHETGTTIPFALNKLQERGKFFVPPGVDVYEGQIVGENSRDNDLMVNVIKTKKLTNMRSAGADDKVKLAPPIIMSLEQSMEYIADDEYVELTPKSIRLRKILLKEHERKRAGNAKVVS
ncbi:MAG: EF-Tu/IF-2/RF-3 family GTPase, partial [Bacteroidota bacterium]